MSLAFQLHTKTINSPLGLVLRRWATNLGGGNTQNGRDSIGRRLGVKRGNGTHVNANEILIRQRGYQYWPGTNIVVGRDHTLHAKSTGVVLFSKDYNTTRTYVNVIPDNPRRLPSPVPNGFLLKNIAPFLSKSL